MSFRPHDREAAPRREMREMRERLARRPVALVIVGLLLLALVVGGFLLWASYGDRAGGTSTVEDSVESGTEPVVRLTNGPGRVYVEGVEGTESVEVSAKTYARGFGAAGAQENAAAVPVEVSDSGSAVEVSSDGGGGTGVDYELRVPSGSTVEVESEAGDVTVSGLDGGATVRARSGDVAVRDVRGSIVVEATEGDVTVESVSTETGDAMLSVGSGDVSFEDLVVGILETRVESGDVTLSGRFSGSGSVLVQTGSIYAQLPPEDARDLDLEARVGEVVREGETEQGAE